MPVLIYSRIDPAYLRCAQIVQADHVFIQDQHEDPDGDLVIDQRSALRALAIGARQPAYAGDAASYLAALTATGEASELLDPGGLGGFTWLLHGVGVDPRDVMRARATL